MPFLGTVVNFISVFIFGILGALSKKGIPKRISDAIMSGMGICVIYIGIDGTLENIPLTNTDMFLSAALMKTLIMIVSIGVGTLIGELIDIDKLVKRLGDFLERKIQKKKNESLAESVGRGSFSRGFVSCSILFCVGAMAINGAFADAVGKSDILLAKSVIDSIVCFVMASTLGMGCAFSAFMLLLYQGGLAVVGYFISSVLPADMLSYMSVTGSLIIILIGTNMLGITNVKTANMIPAIFLPILLTPLFSFLFG